jgi:hypothetical protein
MVDNDYIRRNQEAYSKIISYDIKIENLNHLINNTQLMKRVIDFNIDIFTRFLAPEYFNYSSVVNKNSIANSGYIPNKNNPTKVDYNISYQIETQNIIVTNPRQLNIDKPQPCSFRQDRDGRTMLEKEPTGQPGDDRPWFIIEKDNDSDSSFDGSNGNNPTLNPMCNITRSDYDNPLNGNAQGYESHYITNYIKSKEGSILPFSIQETKEATRYNLNSSTAEYIRDPHINLIDPALIYILYHHNLLDICIDLIDNVQDIQLREVLYGLAKFSLNDKQERSIINPTVSNYIYSTKITQLENKDIPPGFILITFQRPTRASYFIHEDIYFMIGHRKN